ncbi:MAG: phytanoyl-CoA dioxygenase family protein [Candidatus Latescibacterota bacterium]|nr:phytanoyl-CoA dioxygenase family protein [Candidatus Latescibacterota bacterium]
MNNPLTAEHVAQFRDQGWTCLPGLFDDREVAALQAEVARFQGEGLVRNVRTDNDGETHSEKEINFQLIPLFDKSDLMRALPFDPRVVNGISALIGDPFLLHLDQMFLKPAKQGTGTAWHQDNAYFKISDPLRGTAMWVAIHDAHVGNGTLQLLPGSHRHSFPHERDPYSDHHITFTPPDDAEPISVEVKAGGAAFFCYGTAHCTGDNPSDKSRAGVAFHFLHGDYAHDDLVAPDRNTRPFVTGPEAQGGIAEYGIAVGDSFGTEVERTLTAANRA